MQMEMFHIFEKYETKKYISKRKDETDEANTKRYRVFNVGYESNKNDTPLDLKKNGNTKKHQKVIPYKHKMKTEPISEIGNYVKLK